MKYGLGFVCMFVCLFVYFSFLNPCSHAYTHKGCGGIQAMLSFGPSFVLVGNFCKFINGENFDILK